MKRKLPLILVGILTILLFTGCGSSKPTMELKDSAIKNTVKSLKTDQLVTDVDIEKPKYGTIIIAIQVNAATNKDKAQDLIDTAVRQLASNNGGKTPSKDYLGELWDNYNGQIKVFSGQDTTIVDGTVSKTGNKIRY